MTRIISEPEFALAIFDRLHGDDFTEIKYVTGPGRSGAIAGVYASHILGVPFIPYGQTPPSHGLLIIDTCEHTGKTMRKATNKYKGLMPVCLSVFASPPICKYWFEIPHDSSCAHTTLTSVGEISE